MREYLHLIGFAPGFCPYDTRMIAFFNKELERYLKGIPPRTDEWFLKAKYFHEEVERIRRIRRISPKKITQKQAREILMSFGVRAEYLVD